MKQAAGVAEAEQVAPAFGVAAILPVASQANVAEPVVGAVLSVAPKAPPVAAVVAVGCV